MTTTLPPSRSRLVRAQLAGLAASAAAVVLVLGWASGWSLTAGGAEGAVFSLALGG